ncbi:HD domain-containing protein [Maridesulfovibrio ferrireducens]|uniref:HD domain-containing protein n=1 Tax=Maridesulfovibrio ferrireducens TaxID=246191 RepID=A0A1G9I8V7_9BACT|nr:HD-GYP domain-containing protein [Maridesulfovibrio ferrireducens]SDL21659.1 HD domain-containing protein [Maridesulfovibrio ferrireducens]
MKDIIDIVGAHVELQKKEQDIVHLTVHQFAESLGNAIDAKDACTSSHSEDVAVISQAIGVQMGLTSDRCKALHIAGHLHDIGKIGIPDSILKKKGSLTDEEYEVVKLHPVTGAEIVGPVTVFSGDNGIAKMILHHHERFDGKGYPAGLKGNDIPFGSRIIAVADTLSAMMQDRPYRKAIAFEHVLGEIKWCSGTQLDPTVVKAFMKISDKVGKYLSDMRTLNEDDLIAHIKTV